jgi:phosphoglycolate phosphatase
LVPIPLTSFLSEFQPALVVFDKDGTLIDFHFMWATWITELARRLERSTKRPLAQLLFRSMGYDESSGRVIAGSPVAVFSMAQLEQLVVQVAAWAGLEQNDAERAARAAWFVPDPVAAARPIGSLPHVFSTLHAYNIRTAVVTSDDRTPTRATLEALGIAQLTDTLVCADDGLPNKPAPAMVLRACETLNVPPRRAVMVGDGVADLQAGRAAGMGWCIGVLSGLSTRELLEPYADAILLNVEALVPDKAI